MRLLLDTHVFLWGIAEPEKLPDRVQTALRDETNELLVSAASLWEIALKVRAGKLRLPETGDFFAAHLGRLGAGTLAVAAAHVLRLFGLPHHHRDPFDRLLVAQCQVEGLVLVTADAALRAYAVEILW